MDLINNFKLHLKKKNATKEKAKKNLKTVKIILRFSRFVRYTQGLKAQHIGDIQ